MTLNDFVLTSCGHKPLHTPLDQLEVPSKHMPELDRSATPLLALQTTKRIGYVHVEREERAIWAKGQRNIKCERGSSPISRSALVAGGAYINVKPLFVTTLNTNW